MAAHPQGDGRAGSAPPAQKLQDQQVLGKSTIYQHFIHALQNSKLERTLENLSKNIAKSDKVGQPDIAV